MSEIVDRLRNNDPPIPKSDIDAAINEIERLCAENAAQKAEIERLHNRDRIRIDWDIDYRWMTQS